MTVTVTKQIKTTDLVHAALVSAALAALGCASAPNDSSVSYLDGAQLGRWQEPSAGVEQDQASGSGPSGALPSAASTGAATPAAPTATATGTASAAAAAKPATPASTAGAAAPSVMPPTAAGTTPGAPTSGAPPAPMAATAPAAAMVMEQPPKHSVTKVSYRVTTATYGGRYQPRNVGAIWVEDAQGKLIKSLEVWTRTRTRYLTRYAEARAGARIDVVTTGTLAMHRAHQAMWDLKDTTGTMVKPGTYKLWLEMTEDDGTGESTSIDIDTTQPPAALTPADAPGFTQLKVDLQ